MVSKAKREEQKKEHTNERQVGDAEPIVARNFNRIVENIEFEVDHLGNLSRLRVPFDHAPLHIYPEDAEFDLFRDAFNFAYNRWQ